MVNTRSRSRKASPSTLSSPSPSHQSPAGNFKAVVDIDMNHTRVNVTPNASVVTTPLTETSSSKSSKSRSMSPPRKRVKIDQTLDDLLNKSYQHKPVDWVSIHHRIKTYPQEIETKHLSMILMITNPTVVPPNVVRDLVRTSKNVFTFSALQFAFTCPWIKNETIRALIDTPPVHGGRLRTLIYQSLHGGRGNRAVEDTGDDDSHHGGGGHDEHADDRGDNNNLRNYDAAGNESDNNSDDDDDIGQRNAFNRGANTNFSTEEIANQLIKHSKLYKHCSNLLHTLFEPADNLPPRFDAVKIMLECIPQVLEIQDGSDNDLPLHSVCWSVRNAEYIELFVDTALNIESPVFNYGGLLSANKYGITPMKLIIQKWDDDKGAEMMKNLIDRTKMSGDAIANSKLLHDAVSQKKWTIVKTIIEASPTSLSKSGPQWRIPLHDMCTLPNTTPPTTTLNSEIIQFMIEHGILNHKDHSKCGGLVEKDWNGKSPMSLLSSCNRQTSGTSMTIMKNIVKYIHTKKKVNSKLYLSVIMQEAINIKEWELVQHIIQTYPKSLSLKDKSDNLPLHSLCMSDAPFEVITSAIENGLKENVGGKKKRGGLLEVNKDNERPLELIMARKSSSNSKVLKFMQDFKPKLITRKDIKDLKLLHKVAKSGRSAVARMLLKLVPKAISIQDDEGNLPLHIALNASSNRANRDLVSVLLDYGVKEGVGNVNGHGGLMVMNNKSEAPIDYVYKKLSSSEYSWGERKWNYLTLLLKRVPNAPFLHRALDQLKDSPILVESIIHRFPAGATLKDEDGQFPLQVALRREMRASCVQAIIDANPSALEEFESLSGLPCFALAASKTNLRSLYSLDFVYNMMTQNPTFFSSQLWRR